MHGPKGVARLNASSATIWENGVLKSCSNTRSWLLQLKLALQESNKVIVAMKSWDYEKILWSHIVIWHGKLQQYMVKVTDWRTKEEQ
jgi:hypothetical protein